MSANPKKVPAQPREATFSLRLPEPVKAAMQEAAAADDRTMAQWLIRVATAELKRTGYLPK